MSNMNATPPSANIADALLVSNDAVTIKQLSESIQQLALSREVCVEVPAALVLLNQRKFDAVVVDLQLGGGERGPGKSASLPFESDCRGIRRQRQ